ncbi:uncharacterized protein LOC118434365 [Folsomia candida]|uniref:uncharacterized protein LOC118434365 n=1 Tax=Folsomia candida TaxID=158441 RepID=UPI0016050451|nr:uncharacterized protein LOC118434365 [Folsomia candida]
MYVQLRCVLVHISKLNVKKYTMHPFHSYNILAIDIEIAKDDMRKTWEIVRKFARRWLDKVRRRLNAPKDLLHESVWLGNSKGVLDDTLKDLKELSGYDGVFERWDILIRGGHHSMQKEACDETLTGACAADTGKHATVGSDHGDREKQEKREKRKKYMEQHQKKPEIPLEKCDSEKEIPKKLKKHKAKDKKTEGMDSKQVKRAKNRQEVAKHPIVQAEQELFILPPCQPEPAPTCLTGPPAITLSSDEGLTLLISSSSQPVPEQTYLTGPPGPTYLPPEPTYVPSGPTYLPPGPTYLQPGPTYLPPGPPEQPCLTGPPGSTSSLDQGSTSSLPPDPRLMQPSLCKVTEDAPPSEQSSLVLGDKLPDNRPAAQQSTACLPARKTSSEDFSWVDKIIRNQQTVLQNEKDIVGQGDEDAIEGLIDKRNLSRVASLIAEKALCNQFRGLNDQLDDLCSDDQSHKNLPSAKPRPSDYSFVDQIINDKRDALQKEQKDICKEDPIACESASHGRVAPRPSDYSFVDQVINEQRDALQKEQEAICKEDPIVCQSVSNSRVPPRPSDYSFVDQVINEQRDALQKEQEAICKEDPIACKSISDAQVPPPSDGPRPTLIASELVDQVIKEKKESLERSMNQPNLAAVSEPALPLASSSSSGYLDPNEAGISMIRSEVRLQLNALRGELDYLKSQLAFQGILKPDDDHPSPPPR